MGNPSTPTTQDWVRVEVLILRRACTLLRKQFRKRWLLSQKSEWNDSPEFGKHFVSGLGAEIYKSCGRLHKMTLAEGDTNNWDLNLLTRILQQVDFGKEKTEDKERIGELISYSKKAISHPTKQIQDKDFLQLWDSIENILVSFGDSEEELETLKRSHSVSEEELAISSPLLEQPEMDESILLQVKTFKEEARLALSLGNIDNAINSLNSALFLTHHKNFPELELGALHAMRSDAYLKKCGSSGEARMDVAYLALKDAKQALFLRPAWGLAHYRVGMSYVELGKWKKGAKFLDQALELEPNMEEIKVANNSCKVKLIQFSQEFAPELKTFQGVEKVKIVRPLAGGTRVSGRVMQQMELILGDENILMEIYKGHLLRDVACYTAAANVYLKGAKRGNAEAMYNLGLLKVEGRGVPQDVKGALDLLKTAAKQPHKLLQGNGYNFVSNVGVLESSFLLGLLAQEGIGFPPQKDPFSASVWYLQASESGHGSASHNLALLFLKGSGVAKSEKRALQLFKLGASRKIPESMFALAIHHAKQWETEDARKWFHLALTQSHHNIQEEHCQIHDNTSNEDDDFGNGWTPSQTLIQEFNTVLDRIDFWRGAYKPKEIKSFETGLTGGNGQMTLKGRLLRLLHTLEKEKIEAMEEYFKRLLPPTITFPLDNAKQWAGRMREEMFLGGGGSQGESRSASSGGTYSDGGGEVESVSA